MDPITLILIALAAIVIVIVGVVLYRTSHFAIQLPEDHLIELEEVDGEEVARHIGLAIQMKTISHSDPEKVDPLPFEGLRNLLQVLYPQVEDHLTREVINGGALLYTWKGTDPDLEPIALAAHQDVVPANEATDSGWSYPPFAGEVADGYVWGRGALDCKGSLISIMEAVNNLIRDGFEPRRTVYLLFGHDEECSGSRGAVELANVLDARGVRLALLLDEGGSITKGSLPGIKPPVAMIGVTEKGHLTLKLKATTQAGHASTPSNQTAIGALSLAIATLENNPFPQHLDMVEFMMSFVGNEMPFLDRMMLANTWLFGGAVKRKMSVKPITDANTRTTIAPTMIHAGTAENVLPATAEGLINLRIYPGETVRETYERIYDLVADETLEVLPAHGETLEGDHTWDPTEISNIDSPQFRLLSRLARSAYPQALVAPFMMNGATDARHYTNLSRYIFRFTPMVLNHEDQETVHGVNERLSFENAARMVGFMQALIRHATELDFESFQDQDEDLDEEEAEAEIAIRRLQEPLPTKPLRQIEVDEDELPEFDPLPEDDAPLVAKPLTPPDPEE
ncbi:MAG TPA: M20/M25/M40 family metallo-hydrolase [Anaerolineaceae bacterium]|nr:M20/M25/M40 family metallo-hydrolase [Anaerolineaceae bacterium]